ncbi:Endonuclease [hydrothermal vent metagenome]|uniref:Endonuclease n=1 Tax=hydrothermal vent metagenome TaxID=652676 RepID=A0A3B0W7J9_9ZZZZ
MSFFPGKLQKEKARATGPTGRAGEDAAAAFLLAQGYRIIVRNYRRRFGEIDIIAEDGTVLVFVEVKARKTARFGNPFEAVDRRKQRQVSRVALDYITRHKEENRPARFDVVAVELTEGVPPRVEMIKDAFEFCG